MPGAGAGCGGPRLRCAGHGTAQGLRGQGGTLSTFRGPHITFHTSGAAQGLHSFLPAHNKYGGLGVLTSKRSKLSPQALLAGTNLSSVIPDRHLGLPNSGVEAGCFLSFHTSAFCAASKGPAAPSPRDTPTQGMGHPSFHPWGTGLTSLC